MQDRRRQPTVGPFFPRFEDGSGITPFQDFLMNAARQAAKSPSRMNPTYFPPGSPLGRLQRAFGVTRPNR